jgi:hypothetical protein
MYPASLDTFTTVAGTTLVADADHANMHVVVQNAATAIEGVIGTTAGTSIAKNFSAGDFAARINSSNVLQQRVSGTVDNAILGTPSISGGTITSLIGTSQITGGTVGTAQVTGGSITASNLIGYISPAFSTTLPVGTIGTLDLSLANEFRVTFGTANGTLAVKNSVSGQKFLLSLTQDATGGRLIGWFSTIKWPGGTAGMPTLSTAATKQDTFGFVTTGAATFDGYIVGQNI